MTPLGRSALPALVLAGVVASASPPRRAGAGRPSLSASTYGGSTRRSESGTIQIGNEQPFTTRPAVVEVLEPFRGLGATQPGPRVEMDVPARQRGGELRLPARARSTPFAAWAPIEAGVVAGPPPMVLPTGR
jgi:hypothetical protein